MTSTLRRLLLTTVAVTLFVAPAATAQQPLMASLTANPEQPRLNESVALMATSTGSGLSPITNAWDLDGDGAFDDATGRTTKTVFLKDGTHVVRLQASQAVDGVIRTSVAEKTFVIGTPTPTPTATPTETATPEPTATAIPTAAPPTNAPPVARFDRECTRHGQLTLCGLTIAHQGAPKTISAAPSSDPDGQIVKYEWDLDGDGTFEQTTGTTPTVTHTFQPKPRRTIGPIVREWPVSVRVTDDQGAQATQSFTVSVKEPKCEQTVKLGAFTATGACLRDFGDHHRTSEPVTLNGIAIEPKAGQWVSLAKDRIATKNATVSMNAGGTFATLSTGAFEWTPSGTRLNGFTISPDAKVNGLKVTGLSGTSALSGSQFRAKVFVALPAQFGGATSGSPVTLGGVAKAAGADDAFSFSVPTAALGPIGLDRLVVSYNGINLWEIEAGINLPAPAAVDLTGKAGIRSSGKFAYGEAEAKFPGGLPLGGPIPVMLERIKFRIEVDPPESECVPATGRKPLYWPTELLGPRPSSVPAHVDHGHPTFALCGEVALTAGPSVLGKAAARLTAGLGWATYADRPWVLRAFGELELVEIPVAEARLSVHGDGYITAMGKFDWGIDGIVSLSGGINLEMLKTKFNASGRVDACIDAVDLCAGARAIVSSKGIAACLKIDLWLTDWTPGIGYEWGKAFPTPYFSGCDIGDYKVAISRPKAAAAQFTGAARTVDLKAGLPGTSLVIKGEGAPPKVVLTGPDGRTLQPPSDGKPSVVGQGYLLLEDTRTNTTQVLIEKPAAGRWAITPQLGSSTITEVLTADGLDKPDIRVKVARPGVLTYTAPKVAGQTITLVERGGTAGGELGKLTSDRGTLRWTPAQGAAEKRRIVALVEQDGVLREELDVASYRAPKAARPAPVKGLKVTKRGATWKRVQHAAAYTVTVKLRGGKTVVRNVKHPRLAIRGAKRVTVRAVSPSGITGPARSV
ncbi:PKD domain-containing protein [Solirubrobacter phytolaccae]|uniref:PKD domain-containing protein n=1 Tax=Solirubrobacter phytolaccae TaxID=1404360 RepID=A0A9X3NAW4_9ACTN|nr:PKD domain-containing protein [Solirubrobacter phytolaccae]MDA0179322.1 PKD domain-containing protein [Solirubrobacter phytolaccae]